MRMESPADRAEPPGRHDHIVDTLIAERAPRLTASRAWPLVRPALYKMLDYKRARRMAEAIAGLNGIEALEHVAELLRLDVEVSGLERVPRDGRLVIICNHPTGIADGLAVYEALRKIRRDLMFYANADALRVSPQLDTVVIPVEWVEAKRTRDRTRQTLIRTRTAFENERAIAVFPAGRLARRNAQGQLTDPPWMPTALSLARKHRAPVLPIHVLGPWSTLFHLFNRVSPELRDITLFHELLNKRGQRFELTIGQPIPTEAFQGDDATATLALKHYVERELCADANAVFRPDPPGPAEPRPGSAPPPAGSPAPPAP
jgi:putative hemolysin